MLWYLYADWEYILQGEHNFHAGDKAPYSSKVSIPKHTYLLKQ